MEGGPAGAPEDMGTAARVRPVWLGEMGESKP